MTAPHACGLYHAITDTDPACAYECHPECGPDQQVDYAGASLAMPQSGSTMIGSNKTAPAGNRGLTQSDLTGRG